MGMKDSGIEWIGEIPEEWKVKKIKYVSNLYTGNSISDDEKGYYEDSEYAFPYIATKDVSAEDSSIDYENGMYTKQNDHSFRIAPENSTLMCIEGGSAGKKIAKTNQKVSFVNKLCCFNAKKINANYLYMYLKSEAFKEEFNQHISGLIGGVSQTELKSFYILLPMEEEQKLIADFLEDKIGKIDAILADLNKQLNLLEKYKVALISEQFSSDKFTKVKYLGVFQNGINFETSMNNSTTAFLGVGNFQDYYVLDDIKYFTQLPIEERIKKNDLLKNGDIVFVRSNGSKELVGRSIMVDNISFPLTFSGFCIRFRKTDAHFLNKYLLYFFKSNLFRQELNKGSQGTTINNLSQPILGNINIPIMD